MGKESEFKIDCPEVTETVRLILGAIEQDSEIVIPLCDDEGNIIGAEPFSPAEITDIDTAAQLLDLVRKMNVGTGIVIRERDRILEGR